MRCAKSQRFHLENIYSPLEYTCPLLFYLDDFTVQFGSDMLLVHIIIIIIIKRNIVVYLF